MSDDRVGLILYQPQIPQNTGNIGRLCVGFKVKLSLIKPFGFELSDRNLKRAGLDYWPNLEYQVYKNFEDFLTDHSYRRLIIMSKFSANEVSSFQFQAGDGIIMGNETSGFPQEISEKLELERIRLPMTDKIRSYNLANASAMTIILAHQQLKWELD